MTVSNVSILIADTCINVSDSSACVETFSEQCSYMQISCVDPLQIQMLIVYNTLLTIASSHSNKIFVSAWSAEHLSLMCVRALFYSFPVVADLFENDHASTLGNHDCHKFTKNCAEYL